MFIPLAGGHGAPAIRTHGRCLQLRLCAGSIAGTLPATLGVVSPMYNDRMRPGRRGARQKGTLRIGRLLGVAILGAALFIFFQFQRGTDEPQPSSAVSVHHVTGSGHPADHRVVFGASVPKLIVLPPAAQRSQLLQMKSVGITSVRFDANWASVEPVSPDAPNWARLDQAVSAVRSAGMSADLIIDGCPPWAAVPGAGDNGFGQPASPAQFAQFAAQVAARYAPRGVRDFEIWNEPNIKAFWQPAPNPVAYTADLKAAYSAIKALDHSAFIIAAGLAPHSMTQVGVSPIAFLESMYAHGAKGKFDALGYHPYSFPLLPDTPAASSGWSEMNYSSPSLRSVMMAAGDRTKPIWLTEFGAPTKGPVGIGNANQALYLSQGIHDAKAASWIGAVYIYTWRDTGTDKRHSRDWFGLLTARGAKKPSYYAVVKAIKGH